MSSDETDVLVSNMKKLIPDLGKTFHPVKLSKMDSFDMLSMAQRRQINVKLQGPTGSGKTTIYEAYCQKTKQPHFVANMKGSTTSEELIGAFVPNDEKGSDVKYVWKDGVIVRAVKYSNITKEVNVTKSEDDTGKIRYEYELEEGYEIDIQRNGEIAPEDIIKTNKEDNTLVVKAWPLCTLTIEEINFSPEELMSVWFSLLDIRRNIVLNEKNGEVYKSGKFLSVNATMNPDYIGTNPLNEALNDRFLIKLNVEYDKKVENKLIIERAKEFDMHVNDIQFIKKFVNYVRKAKAEERIDNNISTRMIEAFMTIKGNFGEDIAQTSLINAFSEEDESTIKQLFDTAKAESNTIDLNSSELDGIDLSTFKGYQPQIKATRAKRKTKPPF